MSSKDDKRVRKKAELEAAKAIGQKEAKSVTRREAEKRANGYDKVRSRQKQKASIPGTKKLSELSPHALYLAQ